MPKTREQFDQLKKERRKSLLQAGLHLFAVKGYDLVTSDDITKTAGCSHGLLFHYFGNKEEYFKTMLREVVKLAYLDIIKDVDDTKEPNIYIYDLIDSYLNALKSPNDDYACVLYLIYSFHFQKKLAHSAVNSRTKEIVYWKVVRAVEDGIKKGYFYDSNPEDMVGAVFACISALSYKRILVGYENYTCPDTKIILRVIQKDKKEIQA